LAKISGKLAKLVKFTLDIFFPDSFVKKMKKIVRKEITD